MPFRPEMQEDCPAEEAACEPGGNYGLCKTHSTCEMVHKMLADAQREIVRLRAQLGRDA